MNETRIIFPCDYPIKVLGDSRPSFYEDVCEVVIRHDPTMTTERTSQKTSKKGNFTSIRFMLLASSEQQIQALFSDLKEVESVRLVL